MNLLQRAKHLLRLHGLFPKKTLGQHFTVDLDILQRLVSHASLTEDDIVLEVGAGLGFLTKLLSKKCKKVVAVELDSNFVSILRKQFYGVPNVDLIDGDILKISIPYFNKVVSAPPYSISSPLLFHLLENTFDLAVLILQKEFAERLGASVGSKDYGRLTINIYYKARVELLDYVSRTVFYPRPDVDSMIVRLKPRKPPFHVEDEEAFFGLVRTLFTQRNRKVRNGLIPLFRKCGKTGKEALKLADSIVYSEKRVRELAPEELGIMSNELYKLF
jgi:16S rRNA (adenine1518-N6/adenine1519-N6)-dimethyltransferase